MTDWEAVRRADFGLPQGLEPEVLIRELSEMLTSRDPVIRDQIAYSTLATWIDRDALDFEQMDLLGDQMAIRFGANEIQTRTFAPLILDCLVSKGRFSPSWLESFEQWYPREQDLRGFDPELGWLHAVAHGADLLGAFGQSANVKAGSMLELARDRLVQPTGHVWRDHEDDRLGYAIALTLTRQELTEEESTRWLDPILESWKERVPGAPPAQVTNAVRTLRMLFVLLEQGVRPSGESQPIPLQNRDGVRDRLVEVLHAMTPYMW